jgi:hypothetical protein
MESNLMGKPLGRTPDTESVVGRAARYHNEGLTPHLIAERMDVQVNTVYGYLSRARYRAMLTREDEPPPNPRPVTSDKTLRTLHERIVGAGAGENIVYCERVMGWSKVPHPVRKLIMSLADTGLIVPLVKRDDHGTFSMIAQRTKKGNAR